MIKILTTGFSLASCKSGHIFAHSLLIGAMIGIVCGNTAQGLWPLIQDTTLFFSLIDMGALVGGTTLAPIMVGWRETSCEAV